MLSNHGKTTALDDLHSHLTQIQFTYLLSVLSSSTTSSSSYDYDGDTTITSKPDFSPQPMSSSDSDQVAELRETAALDRSSSMTSDSTDIATSIMLLNKTKRSHLGTTEQLIRPYKPEISSQQLSKQMLPLPFQKHSAESSRRSSSATPFDINRRASMMVAKSAASQQDNESNVAKNIRLSEINYSKTQLPLLKFQGETIRRSESPTPKSLARTSCSELQVCKKIVGKYAWRKMSRSSSTESVYAESLPDPNNPMLEIAGKIANEPVNPFPVLRMPPKRPERRAGASRHFTDTNRIESEIDKELRKFQDFRDVSEFFSQARFDSQGRRATRKASVMDFKRRVTNPLYKEYDPTGYHKTEDELALECIQMVCNDFNAWAKTLINTSSKLSGEKTLMDESNEDIGPDFLVQILRTDLEIPENE